MKTLLKLYSLYLKPLTGKDGCLDRNNNILTIKITKSTNGTLWKKEGSSYLTRNACGIDESSVNDPQYMYQHHETMLVKRISTCTSM